MRKESQTQYPIARCPNRSCKCTIVYSENPKEKSNVIVRIAEPGYKGITYLCPRCKTMLAVIEKPKVATGFIALPIIQYIATDN